MTQARLPISSTADHVFLLAKNRNPFGPPSTSAGRADKTRCSPCLSLRKVSRLLCVEQRTRRLLIQISNSPSSGAGMMPVRASPQPSATAEPQRCNTEIWSTTSIQPKVEELAAIIGRVGEVDVQLRLLNLAREFREQLVTTRI